MKKYVFILCTVLLCTGCSINYFVYDRDVPKEDTCVLIIPDYIYVTHFNNEDVKWFKNMGGWLRRKGGIDAYVRIPSGEHTITVNYYEWEKTSSMTTIRSADGVKVSHIFEAGNTYRIKPIILFKHITIVFVKEDTRDTQ